MWIWVMLAWMAATQGPAVSRLPPGRLKPGARRIDLEGAAADRINWIVHNYEHLLEQSTILCAPIFIQCFAGFKRSNVILAWMYVVATKCRGVALPKCRLSPGP